MPLAALSDKALLDAYKKAKELKLSEDFIKVLEKELLNRSIDLDSNTK